ncbi:hypothetical protein V5E97_03295 [Singulisphaera sp. Ch08]|uniref:Uncharacterized protein n=1 Tax=Singulisphaera sp. Ch08 TaxID=3120278 RepID=A0AAU7CJ09_9BACT
MQPRRQWEGPAGLGLVALFFVLGLPSLLVATVSQVGPGHLLFVLITAAGLWISWSGLRRGDLRNRLLSLPSLLFFLRAVALPPLRGRA